MTSGTEAGLSESGLLAARAAAEGRAFAPVHARFGVALREVRAGSYAAVMPSGPATNVQGRFQLASVLVLVDAVLGLAVGSALPPGRRLTTLHLRVSTSGARPTGPEIIGRATGGGAGESSALSAGVVED